MSRLPRLGAVLALVLAAGCGTSARAQPASDPWAAAASTTTLVTDPTPALSANQQAFLREVAAGTWNLVSGPQLNPATHLLRDSVNIKGNPGPAVTLAPPTPDVEYTNPALIGNWLTAIVAAKDLGLAPNAQALAAATLGELHKLATYQGFFFRWYSTQTGQALESPLGRPVKNGYVSTVDNGWLGQGLVTIAQAFPELAADAHTLLDAMQWNFLYDKKNNVLYNGYQMGHGYSETHYQNVYSGPRIATYLAIGSGKVPGSLWWGAARTPPAGHRQRQIPEGPTQTFTDPGDQRGYPVFEGHYVYDHIKFVPTFGGSIYQALAPALVVPEQTFGPLSLGLNDRNTALAQGAYGTYGAKTRMWGWTPATEPPDGRYTNYGVPDLAIDQGPVSDRVLAPYGAFLALPVLPDQAWTDINRIRTTYPNLYTQYGFLDSVNVGSGKIAKRYMAISQTAVLMAADDALDHDRLQTYLGSSSYGTAIAPYLGMERFSIQDLAG